MECVLTATPEAEVTWFRNNIPLGTREGAATSKKGNAHMITFTSIKEEQAGEMHVELCC